MKMRGVDTGVLRTVVLRAGQRRLPLSLRWDDVHLKVIVNLLTRQPDDKGAVLFLTRSTESCSCSTKVNDEVMDVLAQPPILNCPLPMVAWGPPVLCGPSFSRVLEKLEQKKVEPHTEGKTDITGTMTPKGPSKQELDRRKAGICALSLDRLSDSLRADSRHQRRDSHKYHLDRISRTLSWRRPLMVSVKIQKGMRPYDKIAPIV